MKKILAVFLLWIFFIPTPASTDEVINATPSGNATFLSDLQTVLNNEGGDRLNEIYANGWISSGCTDGGTAGSILTLSACVGYVNHRVAQAQIDIDFITDHGATAADVCWVALHKDTTTAVAGWTRESGSNIIVDCTDAVQPADPTNAIVVLQAQLAASSITRTVDLRRLAPQLPQAMNTHGETDVSSEQARRDADAHSAAFINSGCLPTVPAPASLTLSTYACTGYVISNSEWTYVSQATTTQTLADSATVWLALHADTSSTVTGCGGGNWTRETATHYLSCASATQPDTPAGGIIFAEVTIAGSVVTAINTDLGRRHAPGMDYVERFASFAAAVDEYNDAGDPSVTLTVSSRMHITTNTTVTSNIALDVRPVTGGALSIDAGVTLTINGYLNAGSYQVVTGAGRLVVKRGPYNAAWRGVLCDNSTDDAAALNAALLDAGASGSSANVFVDAPGQTCLIASTVEAASGSAIDTIMSSATWRWSGAAGGTMIDVDEQSGILLAGFNDFQWTINCDGASNDAGTGVKLGGGAAIAFQSSLAHVNISGCTTRGLDFGAAAGATGAADVKLVDVELKNNLVGLHLGGQPNHVWLGGFLSSNTTGIVAASNTKLSTYGVTMSLNNKMLQIADGAVGVLISGGHIEANNGATCEILYFADPAIDVTGSIVFDDVNMQSCNTDAAAADGVGYFIDANNMQSGTIVIRGGLLTASAAQGKTFRVGNGAAVWVENFNQDAASARITWNGTRNRCVEISEGKFDIGCGGGTSIAGGNIANLVISNNNPLRWRNAADNDSLNVILFDGSNNLTIGNTSVSSHTFLAGSKSSTLTAEGFTPPTYTFATLPAAANGSIVWCSDCTAGTPCTGTGAGRHAFRQATAWNCP